MAMVDDSDYEWLSKYKWGAYHRSNRQCQYYAVRGNPSIRMHREILGLKPGDGRESDHINGNGLDNRRSNLRICSRAENSRNIAVRRDSKSKFRGVFLYQRRPTHKPKWKSEIQVNGKRKTLGCSFYSPEDAAEAYNTAAQDLHGEFCRLN
jgi:hypothetical protein